MLQAYRLALLQLHEKRDWENGTKTEADLVYWTPGQIIHNILRIEAGHTVGKTKLASGIVSHFFDCFVPSIAYTFAPTWEQVKKLLWKEIGTDRKAAKLPGRVLDTCEIKTGQDNWFAQGKATNDAGGRGTERTHGQHGEYLIFVVDEAEGVADYVFDAIDSMASGGIVIVILLANPRTRTSRFHKMRSRSTVRSFRISCTQHPNVLAGREVVPGAVKRDYVQTMVEDHCEVVHHHEPDAYTFTLPFPVTANGVVLPPGTILRPDTECCFRLLGIAPANSSDNTLVPVGRYDAATKRTPDLADLGTDQTIARIGVDVARWGNDLGAIYVRHKGRVGRYAQISKADGVVYAETVKRAARELKAAGVTSLHVRVDGTGVGASAIDQLKRDADLRDWFADFRVLEVHFGSSAFDGTKYKNLGTEMYAEAAESLKGLSVVRPPEHLEADLCERTYDWVNVQGRAVKTLTDKDVFKKEHKRSPDDGDGFVLAVAPDHLFRKKGEKHGMNPFEAMGSFSRSRGTESPEARR